MSLFAAFDLFSSPISDGRFNQLLSVFLLLALRFLFTLVNSETLKKENEWLQLAGRVGHAGAARQLEHAHLCTASKNASAEDDKKNLYKMLSG